MIDIVVYIAVLAIVAVLVWYIINQIPMPPPAKQIVTIAFVVVIGLLAIMLLLSIAGIGPGLRLPAR